MFFLTLCLLLSMVFASRFLFIVIVVSRAFIHSSRFIPSIVFVVPFLFRVVPFSFPLTGFVALFTPSLHSLVLLEFIWLHLRSLVFVFFPFFASPLVCLHVYKGMFSVYLKYCICMIEMFFACFECFMCMLGYICWVRVGINSKDVWSSKFVFNLCIV